MTTEEPLRLHLVVVGAGLAGLAAAITARQAGLAVTLLEKAAELHEVGAGLQVTPNATRLFKHWGIFDELEPKAAVPSALTVRRYDGTRILAHEPYFQKKVVARYAAPFWDLHRVDVQRALAARARALGAALRLGAEVVELDLPANAVVLAGGERVQGDVVLAADGLWSRSRAGFLGLEASPPLPTGDLAFRIVLHSADVRDPELRAWIEHPTVNFWIGPHAHAVAYSVRGGDAFNLVLLAPDDLPERVSRASGDIGEMKALFEGWDPLLAKFLSYVKSVDKWKLMHLSPLERWKSDTSNFVMAGDACHPMLPYLAQGANSSLEDGAMLGRLLGGAADAAGVQRALGQYEAARKARGEAVVAETFRQRDAFHLPDGPEQRARDDVFARCLGEDSAEAFPSRWTCPVVQPWLYGYDAYAEAQRVIDAAAAAAAAGGGGK